jgi:hypothetical protein
MQEFDVTQMTTHARRAADAAAGEFVMNDA